MRQNLTLKLLLRYVILAGLSAPLVAILTLFLFQKITVILIVLGLLYGLAAPGLLMIEILDNYLPFLNGKIADIFNYIVVISLIPWVIWVFLSFTEKKKWTTFLGLFILFYVLYVALAYVLVIVMTPGS